MEGRIKEVKHEEIKIKTEQRLMWTKERREKRQEKGTKVERNYEQGKEIRMKAKKDPKMEGGKKEGRRKEWQIDERKKKKGRKRMRRRQK